MRFTVAFIGSRSVRRLAYEQTDACNRKAIVEFDSTLSLFAQHVLVVCDLVMGDLRAVVFVVFAFRNS